MKPMNFLRFALAAVALVLVAPGASAANLNWNIVAYDDVTANQYYFTLEGQTEKNPTLKANAGDVVNLTLRHGGDNQPHNIKFLGAINKNTSLISTEGATTVTFTIPASADGQAIEYHCVPHQSQGMKGTLEVGTVAKKDDGKKDGDDGTPAPGLALVALGLVAVALLARRRA